MLRLLSQQRHVAAASEAVLHEAALGSMSRGALDAALGYAVRAAAMSPLDENHQALLIRLYRLVGDDDAAAKQFAACTETFTRELGVAPGPAVETAMREPRNERGGMADDTTIAAIVEAGSAAVAAGAVEAGVHSLRTAARLADDSKATPLRVSARLALAEALIHSLGGLDEAGLAALHEADEIALANDLPDAVARARAELGYVDFLRGRYDRAEFWLTEALKFAAGLPSVLAKATTYLGSVESDRSNYARSSTLLEEAVEFSHAAGEPRLEAYGCSMLGRLNLLRYDVDLAAEQLDLRSRSPSTTTGWRSCRGHRHCVARRSWRGGTRTASRAFSSRRSREPASSAIHAGKGSPLAASPLWRRRQVTRTAPSEPCMPPVRAATGSPTRMSGSTATSSTRNASSAAGTATPTRCGGSKRCVHSHRDTACESLTVRSLLHGAALGDAAAAALLAAAIDNPSLHLLLGAEDRRGRAVSGSPHAH